jgi:uncharacterized membrane protein HdeD (DUF308 family)
MTSATYQPAAEFSPAERAKLHEVWLLFFIGGIALLVLGLSAIGSSFIATLATVMVFGILLLLGSIFQIVSAFWARRWRGFVANLLVGVLYLMTGVFMVDHPLRAAEGLTLLIAICLTAGGIMRVALSLLNRFEGWGWVLFSGLISFVLGVSIWRQWPVSGLWVIGLFLGIEMVFGGWSWIMLGLAARSMQKQPT